MVGLAGAVMVPGATGLTPPEVADVAATVVVAVGVVSVVVIWTSVGGVMPSAAAEVAVEAVCVRAGCAAVAELLVTGAEGVWAGGVTTGAWMAAAACAMWETTGAAATRPTEPASCVPPPAAC